MSNSGEGGGTQDGRRLVGGRYRLTERIGSGGMGTVWRARDELVEREVAVKQPRLPGDPQDAAHQRIAHRLHREVRAAARVDHPSAVSVHDVVVEDGLPWIVMELVRGESLHEVLQRGALKPAESARIGLAVVGALRAAHSVGIVHRDVKPANVLIGQHGRVVLTDFGIAHIMGEESLTMSGEFVGSLEFIAPERMSGKGAGRPPTCGRSVSSSTRPSRAGPPSAVRPWSPRSPRSSPPSRSSPNRRARSARYSYGSW